MADEKALIGIIILIVTILVGLVLLPAIASPAHEISNLNAVTNESTSLTTCYTAANQVNTSNPACNVTVDNWYSAGDWRLNASDCYLTSVVVKNGTGTALTKNTDYKIYANLGKISFLNTTATEGQNANLTFLAYDYCPSGYSTNSTDRALSPLIVTFAIIALLIVVVLYFKDKIEF